MKRWRTPGAAMLWEIWIKHRRAFAWQGVVLLICTLLVHSRGALEQWTGQAFAEFGWGLVSSTGLLCYLGALIQSLGCFSYMEIDSAKVQSGFPSRLLLKPVTTLRLVAAPMFFGGIGVVATFLVWNELVLQHLALPFKIDRLWVSAVSLSFTWWMQAVAWSFPHLPFARTILLCLALGANILVTVLPLPFGAPEARWNTAILMTMLAAAPCLAAAGVKRVRSGSWESPSKIGRRLSKPSARTRLNRFYSAFAAQFWLEWRRSGLILPFISCGCMLTVPILLGILKLSGGTLESDGSGFMAISFGFMLTPLLTAGMLGTTMAKFDSSSTEPGMPVFIAARPMTNGSLILAKLAMAAATSALTWVLVFALFGLLFACFGGRTLCSKAWDLFVAHGPIPLITGLLPAFLILTLWTFKNVVDSIWMGLIGRTGFVVSVHLLKFAAIGGVIGLGTWAKLNPAFGIALLRAAPLLLGGALALKLLSSGLAFLWGWKRKAISLDVICWIAGGWLAGGLLITIYAWLLRALIPKPELWSSLALAGFNVLPLTGLALAPIVIRWNRHQ